MDFFQQHADTLLLFGLICCQALQGWLAFEVSVRPTGGNVKAYRAAFLAIALIGILLAVVVTRRNGVLEGQIAAELHQTAGEVHKLYSAQIGHPPSLLANPKEEQTKPAPKVSMDITAVLSHGDAPPPARRILKLWATVKNVGSMATLVNDYRLAIRIPGKSEFVAHPASPFTDDTHFVSLEAQTGNQPVQSNGEVQGNLMFIVDYLPVSIDSDQNIEFILSARANGRTISKTETVAEISRH